MTEKLKTICSVADLTTLAPDLLDIVGALVIVLDVSGNVVYVNSHALETIGRKKDEVMCQNWIDLVVGQSDKTRVKDAFKQLISGKTANVDYFENSILTKDGESRIILWHSEYLRDPKTNKVIYLLSSGSDITDLKNTETALRSKDEALRRTLSFSSELINMKISGSDYQKFTDAILDISGASYASFNLFDEDGLGFTTVAFSGIGDNLLKASKLLGFEVVNKKWDYDPVREKKIKGKKIVEFAKLDDLTGVVFNKNIAALVEKAFNIGPVAVVNIARDGRAVGDFTLIFERNKSLVNKEVIELFADQAALLLYRNFAEASLEQKILELEKINDQMTGREIKMIELKKEIARLTDAKK